MEKWYWSSFYEALDRDFKDDQGINKVINQYIYLGLIKGLLNPRSKYVAQWRVK